MRFEGRVAILSGAASGMGLLSAQRLAAEGAKVVLTDVDLDAVTAAANEIVEHGGQALGLKVDVREWEQVSAAVDTAVERYGSLDILINCAGGASSRMVGKPVPWWEQEPEVIEWGVDVNLKGALLFSRAAMAKMVPQGRGVILSLGSVDGVTGSGCVDYGASKTGIVGLTRSIGFIGASHGIRACCVSPGPVLTRPEMANMKTRLGRAAEPAEIVNLMLYLCSDDASFVTGANYVIDGGRSIGGMA